MANAQSTVTGQRIKARRQERKMSQVALAAAVALSQQRIGQIETGAYPADDALIGRIASVLGTTVQYLLADMPMTEQERDAYCLKLACAASDNVFLQCRLQVAMGAIPGMKPVNKAQAIDMVGRLAVTYNLTAEAIKPILEFIRNGG